MSGQQETARRAYNRMSGFYRLLSDSSEKEFIRVAIDQVLLPREGQVILEPGFGTGQVVAALAERVGSGGKVYGIDVSDGMLRQATKHLIRLGLADRAVLTRGSATDLPYPDEFFDAVFMSFTLELFPADEIPVVLAECARVLKPTGRLCVACMSDKGKSGIVKRLYVWSHRRFPRFVDCRPIDAERALRHSGYRIHSDRLLSMWGLPVEIVLASPNR